MIKIISFLLLTSVCLSGSILDVYKRGTIKIKPAKGYALSIDEDALLLYPGAYMAFSSDNAVFVSNSNQHCILKFDGHGNFKNKFGQKGSGPGDLYYPNTISVLDKKYLIIGEYASSRRFSVFSLNGKCIDVIKTPRPTFLPIALKNNKVAYLSYKYRYKKKEKIIKTSVFVIDIGTKKEIPVTEIELPDKSSIKLNAAVQMKIENNIGEVMLARTGSHELLVGTSNSNQISIYSISGNLKQKFKLDIKPQPVTIDYIKKYKASFIRKMERDGHSRPMLKKMIKHLKKYPFERMFSETLPYFRSIKVDGEGNILVFPWTHDIATQEITFQVYSRGGTLICKTKIDPGDYHIPLDESSTLINFTSTGLYGIFQLKNSDNDEVQLVKVKID